jgi:hypothetical protein
MASCKRIALMALLYVDEEVLFDAASAMTNTEANASAAAAWLSVIPRFSIPSTQGVKKKVQRCIYRPISRIDQCLESAI